MKISKILLTGIFLTLFHFISQSQVYKTIRTGQWTQAATWAGGNIPPANSNGITIKINQGHTITFNGNGAQHRVGQNVTIDIEGTLNINGWGGFQVGNNIEILIRETGVFRNGQNFSAGQNALYKIWGSFNLASVFTTGINSEFIIYNDGVFTNTSSFTAGNNSEFLVFGELINRGHNFTVGNNVSIIVEEQGYFHNQSTFVAGGGLDLLIKGVLENRGYQFQVGDNSEIYITDTGELISTSTMILGNGLLLQIEGLLQAGGWNFSIGNNSEVVIIDQGNLNIIHSWGGFFNMGTGSVLHLCNGEDTPPANVGNVVWIECDVLPVELISFDARQNNNVVELFWTTASETNSFDFWIEKSKDGISWEYIGSVASAGFSNELKEYTFVDYGVSEGLWYYRLRQNDLDGSFEYFSPVALEFSVFNSFGIERIINNGSKTTFHANFLKGAIISIFDISGRLIYNEQLNSDRSSVTFDSASAGQIIIFSYIIHDSVHTTKLLNSKNQSN